jgi:hypothetical protein
MQPDAAVAEPTLQWPVPAGWKHETFALPPEFAPEFPSVGPRTAVHAGLVLSDRA